jgi:DNA mismatch repair protein MutS2
LRRLNEIGALTICSTHYGDLKTLAHSEPGYENASMEFDDKTMTPSYRMRPGIAGSSKAISVASRLGLAPDLVEQAQTMLESSKEDFEHRVDELEQRLSAVSQREDELSRKETAISNQERYLQERSKALDEEHNRLRFQSANQFSDDYQKAKKLINELTANLQKTPSLSRAQKAKEKLDSIKKELEWLSPEEYKAQQVELRVGQTVRVRSLGQMGILESMPGTEGDKAQVRVGRLKVKVSLGDLDVFAEAPHQKQQGANKQKPSAKVQQSRSVAQQDPVFVRTDRNTLDLRGVRVDEGLQKLERFLDEAYLEHMSPLMIIHGHGTGAMKSAVRDFVRACSYKNKSRPGETYEGGDGVTVVNFS